MATNKVNLDALIPREDFSILSKTQYQRSNTIKINDLDPGAHFYNGLRKPDFQRETASWEPKKIHELVKTYVDGDLVPAVILWGAGETTFVIDGAHRMSALIAWVQDDYGDGARSRFLFKDYLPQEQMRAANETRKLINSTIGTYKDHATAFSGEHRSSDVTERAKRLGALALQLQWISAEDAKKAEASFFKINQSATVIDPTELKILKARTSPNALAARTIVRSASGHRYWSGFANDQQDKIENLGREIHSLLFSPQLDTPIKTLDLPVGGRAYGGQTLPLIFDLVSLANDTPLIDSPQINTVDLPPEDQDGSKTIKFLKNTRKVVKRLTGSSPSSLGLHPAVYFYSTAGRYQPTAFLGTTSFILELEKQGKLNDFTKVRRIFEDFLVAQKHFFNQVVTTKGSTRRGIPWIRLILSEIFQKCLTGASDKQIIKALQSDPKFDFLTAKQKNASAKTGSFDRATKSEAFLRSALEQPLRCKICEGLLHKNAIQSDHVQRVRDRGSAGVDNAQVVHPYCNSTYKN